MLYLSDFYLLYILAFFAAIGAILTGQAPVGIALLIYVIFGIFFYLRYGTVRRSLEALRKGKIDRANRIIRQTKITKYLDPLWKAYYYFICGIIAFHNSQMDKAYACLIRATNTPYLRKEEYNIAMNILENLRKTAKQ